MADSAPPAVLFTVLPYWFDGGNPAAAPAGIFSSIGPAAHPGEPEAGPSGFTRTVAVPTSVPSSLHIQSASATLALSRRPLVTSSATNLLLSATASIAGAAQAAGGASGSQFVLSSLATQPTPSASASASSGTAHTSADTSSAQQAASTSQANETWPLTLAVMLLVSLGIYLLMVSPILGGYLASGRWRSRSYFLSPSAAKAASAGGVNMPYPQRARPASKFTAWVRGAYNRSLLVQLPLVRLTLGQCLVLFVYTACVVIATFTQSGNVGKDAIRSGRIAVAQMPFLFALATKNNIVSLLIGKSYTKLNYIHRFAGRSVFVCSLLHSLLYIQRLSSMKRLDLAGSQVQLTGLIAVSAMLLMFLTSLRLIRNAAYRLFMFSHIVGWMAMAAGTYMHVEYARPWVLVSMGILASDFVVRVLKLRVRNATLTSLGDGEKPTTQLSIGSLQSGWNPGSHVWVRRLSGARALEVHPFSIAHSADLGRGQGRAMTLYAKSCGDWSKSLHEEARDAEWAGEKIVYAQRKRCKVVVEGPYGGQMLASLLDKESVMLLAGGSGITFVLNVLETLIAASIAGKSAVLRIRVIYVLRNAQQPDVRYFQSLLADLLALAGERTFLDLQITVHDTAASSLAASSTMESLSIADWDNPFLSPMEKKGAYDRKEQKSQDGLVQRAGRPNLTTALNHLLNDTRPENGQGLGSGVALAACGPAALIEAARKVARTCDQDLAYRAGGVAVHTECFGW